MNGKQLHAIVFLNNDNFKVGIQPPAKEMTMPGFRAEKIRLSNLLEQADWSARMQEEARSPAGAGCIGPLLSFLPRPEKRERAAWSLGFVAEAVAGRNLEDGRILVRRLMWSLNEESGNLGWGVPEAMGCILAQVPALAREYARIFLSYAHDTGREDNYLDHAPLRAGVFRGAARLAETCPAPVLGALPILAAGMADEDAQVRGMAVLAVGAVVDHAAHAQGPEWEKVLHLLCKLAEQETGDITFFDGTEDKVVAVAELAATIVKRLNTKQA